MAHRPAAQTVPANHDGVERQELQEPVWADEQSRIVRDASHTCAGRMRSLRASGTSVAPGGTLPLSLARLARKRPTCRGDHSVMT